MATTAQTRARWSTVHRHSAAAASTTSINTSHNARDGTGRPWGATRLQQRPGPNAVSRRNTAHVPVPFGRPHTRCHRNTTQISSNSSCYSGLQTLALTRARGARKREVRRDHRIVGDGVLTFSHRHPNTHTLSPVRDTRLPRRGGDSWRCLGAVRLAPLPSRLCTADTRQCQRHRQVNHHLTPVIAPARAYSPSSCSSDTGITQTTSILRNDCVALTKIAGVTTVVAGLAQHGGRGGKASFRPIARTDCDCNRRVDNHRRTSDRRHASADKSINHRQHNHSGNGDAKVKYHPSLVHSGRWGRVPIPF